MGLSHGHGSTRVFLGQQRKSMEIYGKVGYSTPAFPKLPVSMGDEVGTPTSVQNFITIL